MDSRQDTPLTGVQDDEDRFAKSLRTLLGTIDKMVKAANTYSEHHPAVQGFLKEIQDTFHRLLAARDDITLEVAQFTLACNGETVYENPDPKKSLAFSLYKDGIRKITFQSGLTHDEVARFCRLLRTHIGIQSADDDFVTLIWDESFSDIKVDAQDTLVIENAPATDEDPIEAARQRIEEQTDASFKELVEEQRRRVLELARSGDRIVRVAPIRGDEEGPAAVQGGENLLSGTGPPAGTAAGEGNAAPSGGGLPQRAVGSDPGDRAVGEIELEPLGEPEAEPISEPSLPETEQISTEYVKDLFAKRIAGLNAEEWGESLFLDEAAAKELLEGVEKEESRDLREYVFKIVLEVLGSDESSRVLDELVDYAARFLEDAIKEGQFDQAARALGGLITVPISNGDMRILTAQILHRLGEPEILSRIVQLLNHGYHGTPDDVLFVLSNLSRNAIVPLMRLSHSVTVPELRRVLERVLVLISAEAIDELGGMVRDENWLTVRNVVRMLGELADPRGVSYLLRTIHHPETMVRLETVQALARINDPRGASVLATFLADPEPSVRTQALRAFARLDSPRVLETLTRAVVSADFEERAAAEKQEIVRALAELPRRRGIAFLETLFHAGDALAAPKAQRGFFARFMKRGQPSKDTVELPGPDGAMVTVDATRVQELKFLSAQALATQSNLEASAFLAKSLSSPAREESQPATMETGPA